MVRYVITINILSDEIHVEVSKNGRYADEASFHVSELEEFDEYMDWITTLIEREIMGEEVIKPKR